MSNIILTLSIFVFIVYILIHIYNTNAIFKRLRSHHNNLWLELGSPKWQIHFGDDAYKDTMKFIRSSKFKELNDDVLDEHLRALKRAEKVSALLAVVVFCVTIYQITLS